MSDKKSETKKQTLPRREFLKGAAFSASAAAMTALSTAPSPAEAGVEQPASNGGYQETEHVRTYYSLARF